MERKTWLSVSGGALTGLCNGLFGGGGGMIAVPYLERAAGYPVQRAHATAIAVVLPTTLVSCIVYLLYGLVPFSVVLPVALGAIPGGFLGAKLLKRVDPKVVSLVFALLMLAAGLRMLFL